MPRNDQILRQWRLWRVLAAARSPLKAEELVRSLGQGTTSRTVRRDLEVLRSVGAAVREVGEGRDRRYAILDDGPPMRLDGAALLGLHLALGLLRPFEATPVGEALDQLVRTLERRVPARLAAHFRGVVDDLCVRPAYASPKAPDAAILGAVQDALARRRALQIDYAPLDGRRTRREVHPQGLVYTGRGLYLHALDSTRAGSLRTFRLDRIAAARPLATPLRRAQAYDPERVLAGSLGIIADDHPPRRYVLRVFRPVIARWLEENPWHPSQRVEREADGPWRVTLTLTSDRELLPRVLGLGDAAEVLAPAALRARVDEIARAIAGRSTSLEGRVPRRPRSDPVPGCPAAVQRSPARRRVSTSEVR